MAFEIIMPQLGLTMEEGTVSSWLKHEGCLLYTSANGEIRIRAPLADTAAGAITAAEAAAGATASTGTAAGAAAPPTCSPASPI